MIKKIFNNTRFKKGRRRLRNDMTGAECTLWKHLRRRNIRGFKFRRQFSIDSYILDFYCPQLKLAIEVDGDSHLTDEELEYDKKRQNYIEKYEIQFLRFFNGEIYNDIDNVIVRIIDKINELTLLTTSASPLIKGEK